MTTVTEGVTGPITLTPSLRSEYEKFFSSAAIFKPSGWLAQLESVSIRITLNIDVYKKVSRAVNDVPWYFIAAVHMRERDLSFKHHLYNGDSLAARTVHYPAGRPLLGTPPFSWEASAIDALRYQKLNRWADWSLGGLLFQLEAYNGFGYRRRGYATPYLWSGTQHYLAGKYVEVKDPATGKFKPEFKPALVDKQLGTATLVKYLVEQQMVALPAPAAVT